MNTKSLLAGVKRSGVMVGMVALLMVLASCAPSAIPVPAAQAPAATNIPAAPPTTAPTTAPATAPTIAPAAVSVGTLVKMATDEKFGSFLVDEKGMTLYLYTKDTKNVSNCYDKCAVNWPVLFTTGAPQAGDGLNASLLGTTTRTDGKLQVTYNGWPLYYWIKDTKAGDTSGQDVGGVWFLVSPQGEMVKTPAAASVGTLVKMATDEKFGSFLVDEKGMTLYLYTKDTKNVSNCYDKCAVNWPVLFTTGAPQASDGLNASLLGTTTRTDGKLQVTYNGWPLYYWIKDTKAGDTSGQDVGGVWFLVSPQGEMVKTPAAASETPTAASAAPAAPAKTASISIQNFSYGAPLTVQVGTTVTWTNADQMSHTVTEAGGAFDSGNMAKGATFSYTFTKEGTYDYTCTYHPNMKGQVIVTK